MGFEGDMESVVFGGGKGGVGGGVGFFGLEVCFWWWKARISGLFLFCFFL